MWRVYPPTPDLIVHADWGSDPKKRWMCVARNLPDGLLVDSPVLVGELSTFWSRVRVAAPHGHALVGFDFPLGVPAAYARAAGLGSFPLALTKFGQGAWADFYCLCETAEEIGLTRPFYPYRPGGTKRQHLLDGLGLQSSEDLLRLCERATPDRGLASPLFWTMGPKQVGRAAVIGWRDLITPGLAVAEFDLKLWPFQGPLRDLLGSRSIVVAETYPAEACVHLGITPPGRGWSKTSQEGRAKQSEALLSWARSRRVRFSPRLEKEVADGFGPSSSAEDPFDAVLGALSMIEVSFGYRDEGVPEDEVVGSVEGWILGQSAALPGSA